MKERFRILKHSVLDRKTELEWTPIQGSMTWDEAMKYAETLRLGGHTDWRLPTIEELFSLLDFSRSNPASTFPGMPNNWFWSSSSDSSSSSDAWVIYSFNGNVYSDKKTYSYHVRCVRRGQ